MYNLYLLRVLSLNLYDLSQILAAISLDRQWATWVGLVDHLLPSQLHFAWFLAVCYCQILTCGHPLHQNTDSLENPALPWSSLHVEYPLDTGLRCLVFDFWMLDNVYSSNLEAALNVFPLSEIILIGKPLPYEAFETPYEWQIWNNFQVYRFFVPLNLLSPLSYRGPAKSAPVRVKAGASLTLNADSGDGG